MRLVITTPYFSPKVGGLENYALAIAQGFLNSGNDVHIITSNHQENTFVKETISGLTVYRLPILFKVSNTPINPLWYFQISRLLKEIKPDIINAHLPVPFLADVAVRAGHSLGIPTVVTYHNDIFKESRVLQIISRLYYQFLGNTTLAKSSGIVATSSHYVDNSAYLSKHKSKIVIIPPGVYPKQRVEYLGEKKNIIFVSQLDKTHRHKGLEYLIEAFSELKKTYSELALLIVGKGNDVEHYKELVKKFDVLEQVTFAGYVSDEDLAVLYSKAVCLCLPSTSDAEGFGMVVLEAALQKTPSVGTRVGGISQAIEENTTGLLVPARDVNALKNAIFTLYTNRDFRDSLGEKAYTRVMAEFTWEKQVSKTMTFFRSFLS